MHLLNVRIDTVGLYEKEYISDSEGISGNVVETATVFAGVVAAPDGVSIPSRASPFTQSMNFCGG